METKKKAGIILVNYKDYAEKFLKDAWPDFLSQSYGRENYQIYIVDNASSGESLGFLKKNFPEAKIAARPDGNYAAANNAGISMARQDGCEIMVIANLDVRLDSRWLEELIRALESGTRVGAAQSKMLLCPLEKGAEILTSEKCRLNSLGNSLHYLAFGFTNGYQEADRNIDGFPEIPGYGSGCALAVKKEVLDIIGGYNEDYYMYHDDVDLGWKIKLAGFKIVLAPRSRIYHKYEFNRSVKMLFYMERNRYWALFTFYKIPTILLVMPAVLAMDLGMLLYSMANGWFAIKLKLYGALFSPEFWKVAGRERKIIKTFRAINDREVLDKMVGQVLFQEIENPVLKYLANPVFNLYFKLVRLLVKW